MTPIFLSRNSFYLQLSPHCPNMNKNSVREVKKKSRFLSTGHRIFGLTDTVALFANEARFFSDLGCSSGHVLSKMMSVTHPSPNFFFFFFCFLHFWHNWLIILQWWKSQKKNQCWKFFARTSLNKHFYTEVVPSYSPPYVAARCKVDKISLCCSFLKADTSFHYPFFHSCINSVHSSGIDP